jgi:uncharacterized protein (TIGR01244 family)
MNMKKQTPILAVVLWVVMWLPVAAQSSIAAAVDEMLAKEFKANEPGAAVIVVKDGKVVFRKGYGMANLELGVPVEPDMIFRIGSVTKQFTAVATLMLAEQGKLALTDEITKFLPDYPTQGRRITVEHLLTHTSGIVSYTGLPDFRTLMRKDMSLDELIAVFKDKPMEFAPGERWNYNNSAYVLMGAVIEKASGMKYADFIEQKIFAPLGMKRSFYDDTARIIPRRAAGYSKRKDVFVNAEYLSMSLPHAAGSLISTVDDLALWDAALYTDKIVRQESLKRAWTPFSLNDGRPAKYGYGWGLSSLEGHPVISHGGGINGFTCEAMRLPDDRVYVAILTNRDTGVGPVMRKVAALAAGITLRDPAPIAMAPASFDNYAGVYQLNEKQEVLVTRDGEKFFIQHPLMGRREILPMSETEFFGKDNSSLRVTFARAGGAVTGLKFVTGMLPDETAKRTDKPLPKPAAVDAAIYDRYVGEYELMPGFNVVITKEGGKLMGEPTGQSKLELIPESPTKFAIREVSAQIEFIVEGEKATGFNFTQGGRTQLAKRVVKQDAAKPELPPIRNFLRVNTDFCTGGQPRIEHLEQLKADGVKTILNLRPPGEHRAAEEEEAAKKLGLRYINIPVVYASPKDEDADAFLKVTDDKDIRPAFIHCAAAIRVGAFWMIRRVLRDGLTLEAAEEEAKKIGLVNAPHLSEFAKKYIETHRKTGAAPPIRNFLRVNESFCTGGQPSLEHLAELKAEGVRVIINLRTPGEHDAAAERAEAERLGLRYINIPVVSASLKDEMADEFLKATDDAANRPAFIHCGSATRVGAFWMIRRALRDGLTIEAAEAEARKVGANNAPQLIEFAKQYIERHRKK